MILLRGVQIVHFGSLTCDEWDIVIAAEAETFGLGRACIVMHAGRHDRHVNTEDCQAATPWWMPAGRALSRLTAYAVLGDGRAQIGVICTRARVPGELDCGRMTRPATCVPSSVRLSKTG